MRITIVGVGGIGGTIGGHLARAGADVLLVDTAEDHVRTMRKRGLTIQTPEGRFTVPVATCHPAEVQGPLDVVLLAVKSQATVAAVSALVPHLEQRSWIVSAQNGLNEEVIAGFVGAERTVGAFVNFGADYVEPGLIRYYGPAPFYVGELDGSMSARVQALAQALAPWGEVTVTDNITGYLWTKLGYVAMLCATALVDEVQVDVMRRHPALMAELAAEVYEVALAEGVRCEEESGLQPRLYVPRAGRDEEALLKSMLGLIDYAATYHKPKSGVWRDLAVRKRKTEIDHGLGEAVRRGERHQLRLPLVRRTIELVHEIEDGRRGMSWANLADLERVRAARASSVT
jgi:2-dehydropantoate 2-reductase